tara:strand:+ start:1893 stop:2120 length:228 start_codon:yes stop_codon:yes gene_type:complete
MVEDLARIVWNAVGYNVAISVSVAAEVEHVIYRVIIMTLIRELPAVTSSNIGGEVKGRTLTSDSIAVLIGNVGSL